MRSLLRERLFGAPPAPVRIDRFVVLERLGSGATGVVFEVLDPRLERKAALKLVRPEAAFGDAARADLLSARLVREAQALARLSHPNVVTVYEVGRHGESVYIAMERVSGTSLREAMRERRPWRDTMRVLIAAGHGLAAANAAGIVHRDFKPENVVVDAAGVPRVLDFGLASTSDNETAIAIERSSLLPEVSGTMTGALLGTPGYIAPEVFEGEPADVRSDQFSFAVTAWELLSGTRPFDGKSVGEIVDAVRKGTPAPLRGVPGRVRRALLRGLRADPAERFESLDALLHELERAAARSRAPFAAALAVLVLIGGSAVLWQASADVCAHAADELSSIWTPARAARIRARFASLDAPYAERAGEQTVRELERYATEWRAAADGSCRATHVRHEQSFELLDRRTACLNDGLADLEATLDVLEQADAEVARRSHHVVASLVSVERCSGTAARDPPHPEAPSIARTIGRARLELATGGYAAGGSLAREAAERASRLGLRSLEAEARFLEGQLLAADGRIEDAITAEVAALSAAEAAGDRWRAVVAATQLAGLTARAERREEAERWESLAAAGLEREDDPEVRVSFLDARAERLRVSGDYPGAVAAAREAAATAERVFGERTLEHARALDSLAHMLQSADDWVEAERVNRRALVAREAVLGPSHPEVAESLEKLAVCVRELGQRDAVDPARHWRDAITLHDRAVSIREQAFGAEHPITAVGRVNRATTLSLAGRLDEALSDLDRAASVLERTEGADDAVALGALETAASIHRQRGELDQARALRERILEGRTRRYGADHPDVAVAHHNLGHVLFQGEHYAEAATHYEEAMRIYDLRRDTGWLRQVDVLLGLARARDGAENHEAGLAAAERALEIASLHHTANEAFAKMIVAQLLWALEQDRPRALVLMREGSDAMREAGDAAMADFGAAWLAERVRHR